MSVIPIRRVVLYKHGVGYFEREAAVTGDQAVTLTFKQREVSDVLKSLTVLDRNGGLVSAVSYDSTTPVDQLLAEIALSIPDSGSLTALLPQLKGARVAVRTTGSTARSTGVLLGVDTIETRTPAGVAKQVRVSVLSEAGEVQTFDLFDTDLQLCDEGLRRDLDFYLRTQLASKKKEARTFTLFAQGEGNRTLRVSYVLESPVWKATYRILLNDDTEPHIQGWAVVDNTSDEDWDQIDLTLVAGLPISFVHDLYTPRSIKRPIVAVQETSSVLPPMVEAGIEELEPIQLSGPAAPAAAGVARFAKRRTLHESVNYSADFAELPTRSEASSVATQTRERQIGDLFEYIIDQPVTIRRNQSALVPIVLKPFAGRSVLLYQKQARAENPIRCVEFENTTGLTLEGGPVTVLDQGSYVGEAMLDTLKPAEKRLVGYAVELAVRVTDRNQTQTGTTTRVIIREGSLRLLTATTSSTIYTYISNSDREQVLYVDHPRPAPQWKLVEPATAQEVTDHYWRFRIVLAAKTTTRFEVQIQIPIEEHYTLMGTNDTQLGLWIRRNYFDKKVTAALQEVFAARQAEQASQDKIQKLNQERDKIHIEQKRIRENLTTLADRPSEKELRERFIKTLSQQEDRLLEIDQIVRATEIARDHSRVELAERLAKLEYEGTVS